MKVNRINWAFAALSVIGWRLVQGQTPDVPENLKPPAGEELTLHVHASGDQIYACDASKWVLR